MQTNTSSPVSGDIAVGLLALNREAVSKTSTEKEQVRSKEEEKLDEIAEVDSKALLRIRTAFPFILFPVVISVDRVKITIEDHYFFFSTSVRSVMIKDIMNITIEESILFSRIRIVDRLIPQDTIEYSNFSHSDAREFRRIVQGLMVTDKQGVDLSKISSKKLKSKLSTIGKVNSVT